MKLATRMLTILLLLIAPAALGAQERSGFRISPSLGFNYFPNDIDVARENGELVTAEFETGIVEGLDFGYRFNDRWGVEFDVVHSIPDVSLVVGDVAVRRVTDDRTIQLAANGNYYFSSAGKLTPFVTAGIGGVLRQEDQSDQDFLFNVGAGVTYPLASWLDARGTIRDYISSFDRFAEGQVDIESSVVNEVYLTVGVDVYP